MTMSETRPLAYSLAEMRRAVSYRLGECSHEFGVHTKWLRGHERAVMEITLFPYATDLEQLDHAERVLAALPNVYRSVRITNGAFGRERDLRWQVRALVAIHSVALECKPVGRGGWVALPNL
jgi:hypothetical protein